MEDNENILDILYKNYTYDQAKEFYKRFSSDIVCMDDVKQIITVSMYLPHENKLLENAITLNFKNKTVSWKDENDKLVTVNGTERMDSSEIWWN